MYSIIDTTQLVCINVICWDGVTPWTPPLNCIAQVYDGTINNGTFVEFLNGSYQAIPAPLAPTELMAIPGNNQIALSWNQSAGASSYAIIRSDKSKIYTTVDTTGYVDLKLAAGVQYTYQVMALGINGYGATSSPVSSTPT